MKKLCAGARDKKKTQRRDVCKKEREARAAATWKSEQQVKGSDKKGKEQ
jgi:hypothetical protein